jgi:hypothetical protein
MRFLLTMVKDKMKLPELKKTAEIAVLSSCLCRLPPWLILALSLMPFTLAGQTDIFDQNIVLQGQNSSIYSILNQISAQTGYYFVYDTDILNSNRRVRLRTAEKPLSAWLEELTGDNSLDFHIIENHILVYRPHPDKANSREAARSHAQPEMLIRGRVLDENTRTPLAFATVAISGSPTGITTNSDGIFTLKLTSDHTDRQISVSYLGYRSQLIPVRLFQGNKVDILMEADYISIQEVMIVYYDPLAIVNAAREKINDNYSDRPVYLNSFYREGVMRSGRLVTYSEGVFQIYKPPHHRMFDRDQVRLIQARTISNVDHTDTLVLKIRAGIRSSLELDFVSNIPDFLHETYLADYNFTQSGIVAFEGKSAYAIEFEQKKGITDPLYNGVLYIERESMAFLGADFEVHPKYIGKAENRFLIRKNRDYRASVEKASYTVRYRYYNGRYFLNHVRADLHLKYRKRYHLFSNSYHVFVELATRGIDTGNVNRFDKSAALRTDRVFSDGKHVYDPGFWKDYSIIAPEQHITHAISLIRAEIESVTGDNPD